MAAVEVPQTLEYRGGQLNVAPVLEVENFTNWKRSWSKEPEGNNGSLDVRKHKPELRPTKDFEAKYNKVKAKMALLMSSDDNEMVEVKVLMTLAEENDAISKEGARNGEWVKIFLRKCVDETDHRTSVIIAEFIPPSTCPQHLKSLGSIFINDLKIPRPSKRFFPPCIHVLTSGRPSMVPGTLDAQRHNDDFPRPSESSTQEDSKLKKPITSHLMKAMMLSNSQNLQLTTSTLLKNERYPYLMTYLHPYEPSQRYQTNSNDVSFIEPYECPKPVVLETEVSFDQNGQTDQNNHNDQNDQSVQNDEILNDDLSEHSSHTNEQIIDNIQNTKEFQIFKHSSSPREQENNSQDAKAKKLGATFSS
ncbi:hypothetical protein Tco_0151486 [Tanacetum coccineum]